MTNWEARWCIIWEAMNIICQINKLWKRKHILGHPSIYGVLADSYQSRPAQRVPPIHLNGELRRGKVKFTEVGAVPGHSWEQSSGCLPSGSEKRDLSLSYKNNAHSLQTTKAQQQY